MSFRSFEFETAPENWYNSISAELKEKFKISKLEDNYRVLLGLYFLWKTTGKRYDNIIFSIALDAIADGDIITKHNFFEVARRSELEKNYLYFEGAKDQVVEVVRREQHKGNTVGVKFGHYRRVTLMQLFEINEAYQSCDFLILIIESEERTKKYKTSKVELTDQQRLDIFINAGLAHLVLITTGTDYSNEYYRNIIARLKPDVLYASGDWSEKVKEEYQKRADLGQAQLIILPTFEGQNYHTSSIEKFIFPKTA